VRYGVQCLPSQFVYFRLPRRLRKQLVCARTCSLIVAAGFLAFRKGQEIPASATSCSIFVARAATTGEGRAWKVDGFGEEIVYCSHRWDGQAAQ